MVTRMMRSTALKDPLSHTFLESVQIKRDTYIRPCQTLLGVSVVGRPRAGWMGAISKQYFSVSAWIAFKAGQKGNNFWQEA